MNATKLFALLAGLLIVTGIFLIGCSDQPETSFCPVGVSSPVLLPADYPGVELMAGQNMVAGMVTAEIVDNQICVTYTTAAGWELMETHLFVGEDMEDMPSTKKGNPKIGQFPYVSGDITGQTTYTACVNLDQFGTENGPPGDNLCTMVLYFAAHASLRYDNGDGTYEYETGWGGHDQIVDGGSWATFYNIQLQCGDDPDAIESETAFAYGCEDYATCFSEFNIDDPDDPGPNRWGWTNGPLTYGEYNFDLWAGAGQCDLSKGKLVGMVTVFHDGDAVTVTYDTFCGFTMDEVQIYVGAEMLPPDGQGGYTLSPGQYPFVAENLEGATTFTHTFDISGPVYLVAHAVIFGDFENYDCAEEPICDTGCDGWILYGSNLDQSAGGDDRIWAIDMNHRTVSVAFDPGTTVNSHMNYPNGNAYDPVNNVIFFAANGAIYYHDFDGTGYQTLISGVGTIACGSFYNGDYYYVENNTPYLYKVSMAGVRSSVGTVPADVGYGDIVFDPAYPGRFIGSGGGAWYWYDVNDLHGESMTVSGPGWDAHKQLAFGSDGVLYAVDATTGQFYTVEFSYTDNTVVLTLDWDCPVGFTDLASGPQCQ